MGALLSRAFAAVYDPMMGGVERAVLASVRRSLLRAASGRVLEVGAGTGSNLVHYAALAAEVVAAAADNDNGAAAAAADGAAPADGGSPAIAAAPAAAGGTGRPPPPFTRLVLVEPSPLMRRQLHAKLDALAATAPALAAAVEVADAALPHLPYPDGAFDTVILFLVLCSVPNVAAAVGEVRRMLAPGGRVLLVEHLPAHAATAPVVAAWQARLAGLWAAVAGGCQLRRETVAALAAGGLDVGGVTEQSWSGIDWGADLFLTRVAVGEAVLRAGGGGLRRGRRGKRGGTGRMRKADSSLANGLRDAPVEEPRGTVHTHDSSAHRHSPLTPAPHSSPYHLPGCCFASFRAPW